MKALFIVSGLAIFLPLSAAAATLHVAQLPLHVEKARPSIPSRVSADGSRVSISASAGTTTPYRNQPVLYTVKFVVQGAISKVAMDDISIANAIVERRGKPKVYDDVENGVPVRVIELHYLITPLQPGRTVVPPAVLKGEIQTPAFAPMIDPFGGQFMLSPKAQQAMNFFSAFGGEPFVIASNQTVLDVKPSIGAMDPWLPLRSLKISENIDASPPIHVGDLVTRKIRLFAEGGVGTQLPSLEAQQNHADFGVYADKPETGEAADEKTGAISGWRNESYSLIPRAAGRLVLPALKVAWWDVANRKVATAELPARAIVVLPGAAVGKPPAVSTTKDGSAMPARSALALPVWATPLLYGFVAALAAGLLSFAFWFWRFRHMGAARPQARNFSAERMLRQVRTIEELRDFLRIYGQERLGKPLNAPLEEIFSALPESWKEQNKANVAAVITGINASLYAGRPVDVEDLKRRCRYIIIALRRGAHGGRKITEKLPLLNPS